MTTSGAYRYYAFSRFAENGTRESAATNLEQRPELMVPAYAAVGPCVERQKHTNVHREIDAAADIDTELHTAKDACARPRERKRSCERRLRQ
eukprot:6206169-Pleurochrysis_carterae.AAC.1